MSESVAIVEKKPHKPGGCAGIFFQLFEWNRRFAKKKLKKLLPPAQPKQCERKFGRDEKLPKLSLIANEKDGGGNNNSKQKSQMRSPSLVARLMGLESMPAIRKSKPSYENSALQTDNEGDKSTKTQNVFGLNLEKENGNEQHELRPQKAQKTGLYETKALTKFKSDVFQFENLLPRSKKHHRPKLVSPLKNPKTSSRKTSSRLIDVASRILEPSLQNSNRAKSAITYSNNIRNTIGNSNNFAMEQKKVSPDIPESSEVHFSTDFMPITACKHCGNQLEKSEPPPNFDEKATPFSSSNSICSNNIEEMKRSSIVPYKPSFEEAKYNKKQFCGEGKSQRGSQSSIGLKHQTLRRSQDSVVRDRVPRQRHRASSASTNFDHSGKRMPMRFEENSSCSRRGGSLSPVRKRRSMSTNHCSENSKYLSSNMAKQRNLRSNIGGEKEKEKEKEIKLDSHSFDSTNRGSTMRRDTKGINVTSSSKKKMASDEKLNAEKSLALNGDELGAILQQKMKELSSQEYDEPKRSTAVILQELISALTAEKAMLHDDVAVEFGRKTPCRSPQLPYKRSVFEAKQNTVRTLLNNLPEDEHPSPGSVLETSFSNESCLSSNFGDGSENYYDGALKPELDLISHVSEVLLSLGFTNTALNQSKLAYAKDVILNMELISKNTTRTLSLLHFLIYEFENLATTMLSEFGPLLGFEDKTHKNQILEFAFDCVIEYIDTKYGRYTSCGLVTWTKMPLCLIANDLVNEIRRWMGFGEYALDEIIEFEMSRLCGKWDDFGIEEYEIGAQMGKDLLQILVDEIVVDLFERVRFVGYGV